MLHMHEDDKSPSDTLIIDVIPFELKVNAF